MRKRKGSVTCGDQPLPYQMRETGLSRSIHHVLPNACFGGDLELGGLKESRCLKLGRAAREAQCTKATCDGLQFFFGQFVVEVFHGFELDTCCLSCVGLFKDGLNASGRR